MPADASSPEGSPLPPEKLAAREWPPLRASLIDIASALDRLDTAGDAAETAAVRKQADALLRALLEPTTESDRAERLLTRLSRDYDPAWQERFTAGQTLAGPPSTPATEAR